MPKKRVADDGVINHRDVTRALSLLAEIRDNVIFGAEEDALIELEKLLKDIDARTGRRDPTVRRKKKPVAKKTFAVKRRKTT